MVKKREVGSQRLDNFGLDSELDFDFDDEFSLDSEPSSKGRNPVTTSLKHAAKGAKDVLISRSQFEKLLRNSMPKEYGTSFELMAEAKSSLRDLYNDTTRDLRPVSNELRRKAGQALPALEGKLPEKLYRRLEAYSKGGDNGGWQAANLEESRNNEIASTLGELFKIQETTREVQNKREDAREQLRENIAQLRHRDQFGQLDLIRQQTGVLASYKQQVESKWQQKTLELNYRQYFATVDLLTEFKRFAQEQIQTNRDVVKNTGLPDFVKLQNKEYAEQLLRNRFINSITDGFIGERSKVLQRLGESARKIIGGKIRGAVSAFQEASAAGDMMSDTMQQLDDPFMREAMGGRAGMVGSMVGSEIGAKVGNAANRAISPRVQKFLARYPRIAKFGNRLGTIADNPHAWLKEWAYNDRDLVGNSLYVEGDDDSEMPRSKRLKKIFGKKTRGLASLLKDIARDATKEDYRLTRSDFTTDLQPQAFSRTDSRSINEIIPGYLSFILRELQIIRTGDEKVSLIKYDPVKGSFGSDAGLRKSMIRQLLPDRATRNADRGRSFRDMSKYLPDSMSSKQKLAFTKLMTLANARGLTPSKDRLQSEEFYKLHPSSAKYAKTYSDHFKQYLGDDPMNDRHRSFARSYSDLGSRTKVPFAMIQSLYNSGYGPYLEELGIIKGGEIDPVRYVELAMAGALPAVGNGEHLAKGVRSFGGVDNVTVNLQQTQPASRQVHRWLYKPGYRAQSAARANGVDNSRQALQDAIQGLQASSNGIDKVQLQAHVNELTKAVQEASSKGDVKTIAETTAQILEHLVSIDNQSKISLTLQQGLARAKGLLSDVEMPNMENIGKLSFKDLRIGELGGWFKQKSKALWASGKDKFFTYGEMALEQGRRAKDWLLAPASWPGKVKDMAFDKFDQLKDKIEGFADLYVRGEATPRLTRQGMRSGQYIDQATKKVITHWKEIKGTVVDRDGNVVLDASDLQNVYTKHGLGQKAVAGLKALGKIAFGPAMTAKSMVMGALSMAKKTASALAGDVYNRLDQPYDVYVKGEDKPRLLKVMFGNNHYFDESTLDEIKHPREIKGPVVNQKMDYLITEDDLKIGIVDVHGDAVSTGKFSLLKRGFNKLKGIGKFLSGAKDKLFEKIAGMGEWLANLFKLDGPLVVTSHRMVDILEHIHDLLNERLPGKKVFGDSDGDGIREGSYQDILRKRKEKKEAAATEKAAKEGKAGGGIPGAGLLAGLKSLFNRKKKGDEEDEESGGGWLQDAANLKTLLQDSKLGKFAGRMLGKGKGLLSLARLGLGLGGGAAVTAAGSAAAGAAASGAATGAAALTGGAATAGVAGAGAATAGAATAGAGAGLATAGAASAGVLATIAGVLTSPLFLGALAIAGTTYLGYKGYRKFVYGRFTDLEKIRYVQYGFSPDNNDYVGLVKDLEDELEKGVYFVNGRAAIDVRRVDIKAVLDLFGVDEKKTPERFKVFSNWYANRFYPIFIIHRTVLEGIKKGITLKNINNLTDQDKVKYIDGVRYPDGPYEITASPIEDLPKLPATSSVVSAFITKVRADVAAGVKEDPSKAKLEEAGKAITDGPKSPAAAAVASAAAGASQLKKPGDADEPIKQPPLKDRYAAINQQGVLPGAVGTITVTTGAYDATTTFTGRVDALTAVRYKTYGLREMDALKVQALAKLEQYAQKSLDYDSGGKAKWKGDPTEALEQFGSLFQLDMGSDRARLYWQQWFTRRFLPTYLSYATAVKAQTGKPTPDAAVGQLSGKQALAVGMAVFSTADAWRVDYSPWVGYSINLDTTTAEPNLNALKEAAKLSLLAEDQSANKMNDTERRKALDMAGGVANPGSKEKTGLNAPSLLERAGSAITSAASSAWNWAADKVATVVGIDKGRTIEHPGKGTGGDINQIPPSKGDGSYAAHKDTIDAASKMVGVDPRLMASMAAIESSFKGTVKAPKGSATGLYQFIDSTWKWMLQRHGSKYGIAPGTPPTDTRANALMGAEYIKENVGVLKKVKPEITDTDVYMAHFLGSGGASKFLRALATNPQTPASSLFEPKVTANNASVFMDGNRPRSVAEIYQMYDARLKKAVRSFNITGGGDGSEAIKPSATAATGNNQPVVSADRAAKDNGAQVAKPVVTIANQNPVSAAAVPTIPQSSVNFSGTTPQTVPGTNEPAAGGYAASMRAQQAKAAEIQQVTTFNSMDKGIGGVSSTLGDSLTEHRKHTSLLETVVKRLDTLIDVSGRPLTSNQSKRPTARQAPVEDTPSSIIGMDR